MSPSASRTTTREKVFMAVIGAVVLGALAVTAYPSLRVVPVARNAQPKAAAQPVHVAAAAAQTEARPAPHAAPVAEDAPAHDLRAIVEKPKQTPAKSKFVWPPPSLRSSSSAAGTGAGSASSETIAAERTGGAPAVGSTTTTDAMSQAVTMSGCLESTVDGDQFRLTDTEGGDAPKARSWRSGFLTKRSAPVELVELSDQVGLRKYVGRRVVATGLLTGRELRVRSLQASGTPCE